MCATHVLQVILQDFAAHGGYVHEQWSVDSAIHKLFHDRELGLLREDNVLDDDVGAFRELGQDNLDLAIALDLATKTERRRKELQVFVEDGVLVLSLQLFNGDVQMDPNGNSSPHPSSAQKGCNPQSPPVPFRRPGFFVTLPREGLHLRARNRIAETQRSLLNCWMVNGYKW